MRAALRDDYVIVNYLLLKLTSRCNINCSYCYWFRDQGVYAKPKLLSEDLEHALCNRIEEQIKRFSLKEFSILLHGGEPLLFGKARFAGLNQAFNAVQERTGCTITRMLTTNGILLDAEWVRLFREFRILPTVSIDGPALIHDRSRIDFQGNGTHERVMKGVRFLQAEGIDFSALAVADMDSDPEDVADFLAFDLGLKRFDIMVPDNNHDDNPKSIEEYYKRLFDLWASKYHPLGVVIRYPKEMLRGVLGGHSDAESIGYGPISTVTINTDGAIEPLDVLRIGM